MQMREGSAEGLHDLPQVTQMVTGETGTRDTALDQGNDSLVTSSVLLVSGDYSLQEASTGLPGRACILHLKEKCSHLGRATRQARVTLPKPKDNMACLRPIASLNRGVAPSSPLLTHRAGQ